MKGDQAKPDTNCYNPLPCVIAAECAKIRAAKLKAKLEQGDGPQRPSLRDEYQVKSFAGKR